MEILFTIGLTVFAGTLGGRICQRFRVPQVTGYIIVGLLLGKQCFRVWDAQMIEQFSPVINLALGIIGFLIGSELKFDVFKKRGRSIYSILFCEVIATFFVVTGFVTLVTQKLYLGILFGALASATAPAATVDVLWENKTRGPLTTTLLAIVALDDVLALVIYGFASVFAKAMITKEHFSLVHSVEAPFLDIGKAALIGVAGAYLLFWMIQFIRDRERILPFALGVILLAIGLSVHFKVDLILSSLILGFTLTNIAPVESAEIFNAIKRFNPPISVLFFVLVGARLDFQLIFSGSIGILVIVYVLSRVFGKMSGSILGGFIGGAQETVTKYLGFCLFSQAGVAIGLAISIYQNLSHLGPEAAEIGLMIINVIVATTFVVQLIGPSCVRFGVYRAGEAGRDINEEDVIDAYRVADLIERGIPTIQENAHLDSVVAQVKQCESYNFCVVDGQKRLLGTFSIGDLRDVLLEQEVGLNPLILAKDIAVPARRVITADQPLKEAIKILRRRELDFLPVVKDEESREFVGLIHYRDVMSRVQKELLDRRGSN